MRFEGQIKRAGRLWLIEAPAFDLVTQGRSRGEAFAMFTDALRSLCGKERLETLIFAKKHCAAFEFSASDDDCLVALLLRRQRQKHGLTLKAVACKLGSTSVNAYARYEQGRARPTLAKLGQLLRAVSPDLAPVLKLAA